jgi:hypothetical protein
MPNKYVCGAPVSGLDAISFTYAALSQGLAIMVAPQRQPRGLQPGLRPFLGRLAM